VHEFTWLSPPPRFHCPVKFSHSSFGFFRKMQVLSFSSPFPNGPCKLQGSDYNVEKYACFPFPLKPPILFQPYISALSLFPPATSLPPQATRNSLLPIDDPTKAAPRACLALRCTSHPVGGSILSSKFFDFFLERNFETLSLTPNAPLNGVPCVIMMLSSFRFSTALGLLSSFLLCFPSVFPFAADGSFFQLPFSHLRQSLLPKSIKPRKSRENTQVMAKYLPSANARANFHRCSQVLFFPFLSFLILSPLLARSPSSPFGGLRFGGRKACQARWFIHAQPLLPVCYTPPPLRN